MHFCCLPYSRKNNHWPPKVILLEWSCLCATCGGWRHRTKRCWWCRPSPQCWVPCPDAKLVMTNSRVTFASLGGATVQITSSKSSKLTLFWQVLVLDPARMCLLATCSTEILSQVLLFTVNSKSMMRTQRCPSIINTGPGSPRSAWTTYLVTLFYSFYLSLTFITLGIISMCTYY